ncbi:MAG: hypothetical protein AAGG75_24710 [Bacteroidota bacterium]
MKSILKLVALLVIGVIVYNYFLGTPEEKESSRKIFQEIKEVGKSVGKLIKTERAKFDAGKYDNALDKIGELFGKMKDKASDSKDFLDRISDLENQKDELKNKLSDQEGMSDGDKEALEKDMERLVEETTKLAEEIEQ